MAEHVLDFPDYYPRRIACVAPKHSVVLSAAGLVCDGVSVEAKQSEKFE
jgi:hypothetical protein